jgi:hypothetical protein
MEKNGRVGAYSVPKKDPRSVLLWPLFLASVTFLAADWSLYKSFEMYSQSKIGFPIHFYC